MRTPACLLILPALLFGQVKNDSTAVAQGKSASQDLWLAKDKADHLVSSAFLVGLGYYAGRQELNRPHSHACKMAIGFSFSLGIAKEIWDGKIRKGKASWKDLVADLAGCAVGYALVSVGEK